jgi:pSer/pThr/pTyr-binding forkhead associated (FHA) protein
MRAHLIQVENDRQVASTALPSLGLEIGRDTSADLPISSEKISLRHARIHLEGDRHLISDLGSANGTFVNGHRVYAPVVLRNGDQVDLAGEVTFVYRVAPARGRFWLAGLAAVLLLAAVVWLVSDRL